MPDIQFKTVENDRKIVILLFKFISMIITTISSVKKINDKKQK